jgi:aryl-alcohol dehydrogenase-like predicted oxidoreductase
MTTITLAGSNVTIPQLGVGTWAWGDKRVWGMGGYDAGLNEESIREAYEASLRAGVTLLDTAEMYGRGESERIIGRLLAQYHDAELPKPQIATKFFPAPWKLNVKVALIDALRASLDRLGLPNVDLYQLHGPISLRSHATLADALASAHQQGDRRLQLLAVRDALDGARAQGARPRARDQPSRVLAAAQSARDERPARRL